MKRIRWCLAGLCILAFGFGLWKLLDIQTEYRAGEAIYQIASEAFSVVQPPALPWDAPGEMQTEETTASADMTEPIPSGTRETAPVFQLDLDALQTVNPDVLGWIYIPDTEISYPLLQGADNDRYLRRSYTGAANSAGSIFMDARCASALTGKNTILYGHSMKNGSMFGGLSQYAQPDFWKSHPLVYLITASGTHPYEVFAWGEMEPDAFCYQTDFAEEAAVQQFIDRLSAESLVATGITPTADDRVLTLSTCLLGDRTKRFAVFARLTAPAC